VPRLGAIPAQAALEPHSAVALSTTPLITSPGLGSLASTGDRPGDTFVSRQVGDRITAGVNVGTGNLLVQTTDFTLPGITGQLPLGEAYNSLAVDASAPYRQGRLGWGWTDQATDIRVVQNADGTVTYLGPTGTALICTFDSGVAYKCPTLKGNLNKQPDEWRLRADGGATVLHFSFGDGRLTGISDRNGHTATFAEAPDGSSITVTGTAGPDGANSVTEKLNADGTIAKLTQTGAQGTVRTVVYNYDTNGNLSAIVDAAGRKTRFVYDSAHNLTKIVNTGGFATTLTYDGSHRVVAMSQVDPNGPNSTTRFLYNSATQTQLADPDTNQQLDPSDPSVPKTTYTLESTGRVTKIVDPAGKARQTTTYTPYYDVLTSTNAAGGSVNNTYLQDTTHGGKTLSASMLEQKGATSGPAQSWTYDGPYAFLPSASGDFAARGTDYGYDNPTAGGVGNMLTSTDHNSAAVAQLGYTNGMLSTSTDPKNNVTSYGYDANNQLATVTPPANSGQLGARHITYDEFGRVATTKTDGAGNLTTYGYDALDRITGISYTDGTPAVTYSYDDAGNLATRTDASGTTTYGYDYRGLLTSRTTTAGINGSVTYGYDLAGNLTAATDAHGTVGYDYNDLNELTTMTTADGKTIHFGYNDDGARTDTWLGTNTDNTIYAAHVRLTLDTLGRLTELKSTRNSGAATIADQTFSYAPTSSTYCSGQPSMADMNQLGSVTDQLTGKVTRYCYGGSGRLTDVLNQGGHDYHYAYDHNGNRYNAQVDGTSVQSLGFDASNQITSTGYGYDPAGNLTSDPGLDHVGPYNAANQLTAVNPPGGTKQTYSYAGANNLERVQAGGTAEAYGRAGTTGQPQLDAYQPAGDTTAYLERDPAGAPQVLVWHGTDYFYIPDRQGSTLALVDPAGGLAATYSYDPYGTITNQTGGALADANLIRYAGGEYDPTSGYTKFGVRYYDPATARFSQPDTINRLADPRNANEYAYAGSDPVNEADPTGQGPYDEVTGDAGTFEALLEYLGGGQYNLIVGLINSPFAIWFYAFDVQIKVNGDLYDAQILFGSAEGEGNPHDAFASYKFSAAGFVSATITGEAYGWREHSDSVRPLNVDDYE
jgi:RHS repeat-associated protein